MKLISVDVVESADIESSELPTRRVTALGTELASNRKSVLFQLVIPIGDIRTLSDLDQPPLQLALHPLAAKTLADSLYDAYEKYENGPPERQ